MLDPWELADAKKNQGIYTPDAAGEGGSDLAAHSEDFFQGEGECVHLCRCPEDLEFNELWFPGSKQG